jgi:DNA repair protein SbcC/Rad50
LIKDIQLQDFIAHKDTKLEFCKGITIFVGHNGSGKSSIIDAVTFVLFGEHTRGKSKRNLVRRGANQAMVQLHFTLNSREFQIVRGLSGAGAQSFSQLTLVSDGDKAVNKLIAGGERKQFGESTKKEVEKVLGFDYDKMRVAAVVQQGELVRIVEAQPKEFKELLNGLIGIDRLDSAYETMRQVIAEFRERLRDETGYTDEEIPKVEKLIDEKEQGLKQTESLLAEYEDEKRLLEGKIGQLEREIERLEPMSQQAKELQNKERQLIRYVNEKRSQMEGEISRMDKVAREARGSLQILKDKDEVDIRLRMVKAEVEEVELQMQENEGMTGKLRGFLECASKIKITDDGKCPVCSSTVSSINQVFDIKHIQVEIGKMANEKSKLQVTKINLKKEETHLSEANKKIAAAEKLLSSNSIQSTADVEKIEADLAKKRGDLAKLPKEILKIENPIHLAIDEMSKALAEEIATTRENIKNFSPAHYNNAKEEKSGVTRKLEDSNRKIGAYQHAIESARNEIDSARKAVEQLRQAAEFAKTLDKIRSVIFNRDGMVGMSLRSWALEVISRKASEYASLFNIGISRIELAEKAREIAITCYGRQGEIDMDSLSGGEKVAVALALRLGIAYMMGSNKLDFVILDEPTTHLDEERRKALVKIISEAFREGAGPLAQLIIITHDSDIFEDSEVDQIYRFAMTSEGSRVSRE